MAPAVGASTASTLKESLMTTGPTPDIVATRRLQSLGRARVSTSSLNVPDLNTITKSSSDVTSEMLTYNIGSLQKVVGESDELSSTPASTQFLPDTYPTLHKQQKAASTSQKPEEMTPKNPKRAPKKERSNSLVEPPGSKHRVQKDSSGDAYSSSTSLVERQDTTLVRRSEKPPATPASAKDSAEYSRPFKTRTPNENQNLKPHQYTSDKTTVQGNSKKFSQAEKERKPSSREHPPRENLPGVGAKLNSNAEPPAMASAPTNNEPPSSPPFESGTPRMMATGIPVVIPAIEYSGTAVVKKEAPKSYLSSHTASGGIIRNVAFGGNLSEAEEAAVRAQRKLSKGTDRTQYSCRFSLPTATPVSSTIAPSTTKEIKDKEKEAPERALTGHHQPSGKQEIRPTQREVAVIREKETSVQSEGSTKPTDTSSSTVRDRTETSTATSSVTPPSHSQYSAATTSPGRPIAVAPRVPHRAPVTAAANRERFIPPSVNQLITAEYGLYVVALAFAVIIIIILAFLLWPSRQSHAMGRNMVSGRSGATCTSPSCVKNALYLSDLLSWRDGRPCDDFYAFVCSRWTSRFPLSSNSSSSTDDDYVMTLEDQIYASLRNNFRSSAVRQPLKALHDACMDVARSQHQDREVLDSLMSDVSLGDFPLSSPTRGTLPVWTVAARILRKTGTLALLSVSVASKPDEKAGDIVSVGPPELLTNARVDTEEVFGVYTEAVFSAVRLFNKQDTTPGEIIATVRFAMDIEKLGPLKLKGSFWNIDRRRRSGSDLLEFLAELFRGSDKWAFDSTMSELLVWSPGFTNEVLSLVEKAAPHTVMNYLGIRLLIQVAPFIPDSGLMDALNFLAHGKRHPAPSRWQLCLRVVEKALYPLVYASIFTHVKLRTSISSLTSFAQTILDEFSSKIENSPHLEPNAKDVIHGVLSSSAVSLIGPTWCEHEASIQDYIDKLPDPKAAKSALGMYISNYEHTFFYTLSRGSRGRWRGSAFSTSCWYEAHPRTVHVPLLAFNVTQVFDDGEVNAMQVPRLAPQLSRCLFDMLLDEADSANSSAKHWITEDTWKRLLSAEACLAGRQDFLRFGRFRDVLAVQVALGVFEKTANASYALRIRRPNGLTISGSQVFFAYVMLQSCEKSGNARKNTSRSSASDEWRIALLNNDRFRRTFNCSRSPVSGQSSQCSL
ncbi:hypothetical protein HPB48_007407 [Haemaphysalis longicornis]|uniref:Peptidase M13 N-terminal domain-containing protein n=1 Tax=Haemaphysalis longicornis TaxID=44386 RepID=A0A9J6G6V3_HAELO|nr:hypothetical protein HPB48_007407 [Haemaphysalis longicornis]